MYECKYCESKFAVMHTNCPNCGGNRWVNDITDITMKNIPQEKTDSDEQELAVRVEDEENICFMETKPYYTYGIHPVAAVLLPIAILVFTYLLCSS